MVWGFGSSEDFDAFAQGSSEGQPGAAGLALTSSLAGY
jgi:hypothetical protein